MAITACQRVFFGLIAATAVSHSAGIPLTEETIFQVSGEAHDAIPVYQGLTTARASINGSMYTPLLMDLDLFSQARSQAMSGPLMMAYYPDWAMPNFTPEDIDFRRFDWIDFAFGYPDKNFNITWDNPSQSPKILQRLVQAGHRAGRKVKLSIGGWGGSKYMSLAVKTIQSRALFTANIVHLYNLYDLDGIDLDWEYPGQSGQPGNHVSSSDAANFLKFIRTLREALPTNSVLSAAVQDHSFTGSDGSLITDGEEYAQIFDWIVLMNYDIYSSSSKPGPNAPLSDACGNSTFPWANAASAFVAWNTIGFPPSKLVLGIPSYGYISHSNASTLVQRSTDINVKNSDGEASDGQIQFQDLIKQGAITDDHKASGGFQRHWDACSNTPYLVSTSAGQVIAYDDPESIGIKSAFARQSGMLGVNLFDVHGDTSSWDLTDAALDSLSMFVGT